MPSVISTISAAISAIFAVLIWFVYKGQWATMRDQATLMQDSLAETKKSADAAKAGADVAKATLRLASQTFLDLEDVKINVFQADEKGRPRYIRVEYRLFNPSNNAAMMNELHTSSGIVGGGDSATGRQEFPHLITPGKGFFLPFDFGPLSEDQLIAYEKKRLLGWVKIIAVFKNPLEEETTQTLSRRCLCGPKHVVSYLTNIAAVDHDETD